MWPACWTSEWPSPVPQASRDLVAPEICLPYLLALVGSVLIDLLLRLQIIYYYVTEHYKLKIYLSTFGDLLQIFYSVLSLLFLYLFLFRWLPDLRQGRLIQRRLMRSLGLLASLQLVTNMISVNVQFIGYTLTPMSS